MTSNFISDLIFIEDFNRLFKFIIHGDQIVNRIDFINHVKYFDDHVNNYYLYKIYGIVWQQKYLVLTFDDGDDLNDLNFEYYLKKDVILSELISTASQLSSEREYLCDEIKNYLIID